MAASITLHIVLHDIHTTFDVQGSVVTITRPMFDQFWYKTLAITANQDVSEFFQSQVSLISCWPLKTDRKSFTGAYYGTSAIGETHTILDMLENLAYLLEGSTVEIAITITSPPSDGGDMHLNVFKNWKDYKKFQKSVINTGSSTVFKINNSLNHITYTSLNITQDGFYFFGVDSTNGTEFYYNYTVTRYFYNATEYLYDCTITSDAPSCVFTLEETSAPRGDSHHCLLSYTTVGRDVGDPFYTVDMDINKKPFNWIIGVMMGLAVMAVLVLFVLSFVLLCTWWKKTTLLALPQ